jgi:hypothetical protein
MLMLTKWWPFRLHSSRAPEERPFLILSDYVVDIYYCTVCITDHGGLRFGKKRYLGAFVQ